MIDSVVAELRRAIAAFPTRALTDMREQIQSAYLRWHLTTRGSQRQERLDALTEMRLARGQVDEALRRLRTAGEHLAAYASLIEGRTVPYRLDGAGPDPPATVLEPAISDVRTEVPQPPDPADFDPTPFLPPAPPKRTPGGIYTKTRGVWVDGDRVENLVSGEHDRYSSQVNQHAQRLGIVGPGNGVLTAAADVELRFAMRMREENIGVARIVLDRAPCPGRYGCNALLDRFLPPGAVLTVYWPDSETTYRWKTYRGGE